MAFALAWKKSGRGVAQAVLLMLAGLLSLVLLLGILNCRWLDEPLSLQVQQLRQAKTAIPDEQNLYVGMLGMRAPAGEAMLPAGLKRWQFAQRQMAQYGWAAATDQAGSAQLSGPGLPECADLTRCNGDALAKVDLDALLQTHAEVMGRFRSLRQFTRYAVPQMDGLSFLLPVPNFGANEHRLLLLQTYRQLQTGNLQSALMELTADLAYWRNLAVQSDHLIAKIFAINELQRVYYTVAEALAARPALYAQAPAAWRQLLAPLPKAALDMQPVMQGELKAISGVFLHAEFGKNIPALLDSSSGPEHWLKTQLYRLATQPQATLNAYVVAQSQMLAQTQGLPPAQIAQKGAELQQAFNQQCDALFTQPSFYLSNPGGKLLNCNNTPDWTVYLLRPWRIETVRLGVAAQLDLLAQQPDWRATGAIQAALAKLNLQSPWKNQPASFDSAKQALVLDWPGEQISLRSGRVEIPLPGAH